MQYIYFGSIVASATIFLFMGTLLFMQRREGERSRTLLACMMFISVCNYIGCIINLHQTPTTIEVMPVGLMLLGVFVATTYIMYPIEVISPGWLNWKRVLKIYLPLFVLWAIYRLSWWMGVEYTQCLVFSELLANTLSFKVIFRFILALLIFIPALLLWFLPHTRKYNNTDHKWMVGYTVAVTVNAVAYILVISSSTPSDYFSQQI